MAESVARVKILAQIEGLEGFDKLKGAFKGLQQAIGPADTELEKARKQILAFGEAGAKSQQVIKGQIDALKALQAQASIGGAVYRQLGKDVKALGGAYQEAASGVKQFTDAQLKSQIVGSKPSTFEKQIGALKRGLQDLSVYSRQYTEALTEIQRRQIPFNAALGRQNVIAGAEAYAQGGKGGGVLPALPNTTAGLNQRLSELNAEFVNLTRYGTDWIRVSREIANVQRQLNQEFANPAVEAARRRLEASRNTSSGFLAFSSGLEDRIAIQKSIARNQARQPGPLYDAPIGPPEASALFRNIGGISNQTSANQLQLMGRSYQEVANSIRQTSAASDGSLNSLQQQRAAWEQLRATISPLDKEYAQIEREARKAVNTIDSQIGRRQGGNRGGAAQIGQGAGALAASGIFGGPEGFLGSLGGSLIGAAVGGPAGFATGAFLGGSVGAYGGMARQGLGGFADYAAQLEKQRIALQGVAGSVAEYQRALQAAQSVSNQFNVPIGETTQSMTQLSAAVIGAGGKVNDAELVFRNITTAIKATGGGAEQVQGALTAMAQIFSKGKVSAEELQGQLGERLPGAVTAFAEATGRTLPQLQKDLEQGVVGLNDVMKFVISLGDRYTETANKIAGSDADAGQRFQKTLADFRAAIGKELVPIGAELQNAFSDFLQNITPGVIEAAKGLAGAIRAIVENAGAIGNLVKFAAQMGAISLAIKAFIALKPAVSAMFAIVQLGSTQTAIAAAMASPKILALGTALKSLSLLGIITVGVNVAIKGLQQVRQVREELKLLREYDPSKAFTGATRETVQGAVNQARGDLKKFRDELESLNAGSWKTMIPGATLFGAGPGDYQAQKKLLETRIARAQKTINSLDPLKFPTEVEVEREQLKKLQQELTKFDDPAGKEGSADKAAEKARKDAEQLAAEQQRLAEANAQAQVRLSEAIFRAQTDFDRKRFELQQELINKERELRVAALTGVAAETASATAQFFRSIDELKQRTKQAATEAAAAQRSLQGAQFMSSVTGLGSTSGPGAGGESQNVLGFSTQQLSNATAAASKFTGIANMCSESVKTFYKSLGISLPGVTAWADTVRNAGTVMRDWSKLKPGDIVATGRPGDTPHVGVYTGGSNVFHQSRRRGLQAGNYPDLDYFRSGGYFVRPSAMGGKLPAGQAGQMRRNVADQGDLAIAQVDFDTAVKYKALLEDMVQKRLPQEVQLFALEGAKAYKDQSQALRDNVAELQKRQELELSGARQEIIDSELQKFKISQDYARQVGELTYQLEQKEAKEDPAKAEGIKARIAAITQGYNDQKTAIEELTRAQIAFNDAQRFGQDNRIGLGIREGAQQYVESIGTMRQATAQLTQTGIKGVEDAIFSLVTTGTANFKEFAASILKDTARMIIQQLVLRTVMQAIGFLGGSGSSLAKTFEMPGAGFPSSGFSFAKGGSFANGIQPFAMGGIVNKPTLFKFANGGAGRLGLMGEAGPEAIIPLKRGRDGKLGVSGGGGAPITVNVSVDATGSQVQGNAGQGEQLGRAVSQAVQAELIRQKRPGGLLAA
jgi:lambda family phage tail tape measure protein